MGESVASRGEWIMAELHEGEGHGVGSTLQGPPLEIPPLEHVIGATELDTDLDHESAPPRAPWLQSGARTAHAGLARRFDPGPTGGGEDGQSAGRAASETAWDLGLPAGLTRARLRITTPDHPRASIRVHQGEPVGVHEAHSSDLRWPLQTRHIGLGAHSGRQLDGDSLPAVRALLPANPGLAVDESGPTGGGRGTAVNEGRGGRAGEEQERGEHRVGVRPKSKLVAQRIVALAEEGEVQALTLWLALSSPGVEFIDVGQGSALLIVDPDGEAILVDSGPAGGGEAVLGALGRHGVERIALWIHTHFDADHCGGFARVVAGVDGVYPSRDDPEVELLWDRGLAGVPRTDAVMLYGLLAGDARRDVSGGAQVRIGQTSVSALPVDLDAPAVENARGIAVCFDIAGTTLLAPGDLPAAQLERAALACGPVDVLWASHHGAADGISTAALELADPGLTVITAGHENPHCHPSPVTLGTLQDREVWITRAAGLSPQGACEPIAGSLGGRHHIAGSDLWLPLHAR